MVNKAGDRGYCDEQRECVEYAHYNSIVGLFVEIIYLFSETAYMFGVRPATAAYDVNHYFQNPTSTKPS